jgi:hypothetical protein
VSEAARRGYDRDHAFGGISASCRPELANRCIGPVISSNLGKQAYRCSSVRCDIPSFTPLDPFSSQRPPLQQLQLRLHLGIDHRSVSHDLTSLGVGYHRFVQGREESRGGGFGKGSDEVCLSKSASKGCKTSWLTSARSVQDPDDA